MKAFKCAICGKICFSSADLGHQVNATCPYCGADKLTEESEVMKGCNTCVCCGDYIPEGRMVCIQCEEDPSRTA